METLDECLECKVNYHNQHVVAQFLEHLPGNGNQLGNAQTLSVDFDFIVFLQAREEYLQMLLNLA
jgi:hypothetical protein